MPGKWVFLEYYLCVSARMEVRSLGVGSLVLWVLGLNLGHHIWLYSKYLLK